MASTCEIELYAAIKGEKTLKFITKLGKLPDNEADISQTVENFVVSKNKMVNEVDAQMVFIQDGQIVAVESLTLGKLVWCN